MKLTGEKLEKKTRKFYPQDLQVSSKEILEKEAKDLLNFPLQSVKDLELYLEKWSELLTIIMEESAWRFIKMTCNADNKEFFESYNEYNTNVLQPYQEINYKLEKKFYESPYRNDLPSERYETLNRLFENHMELFRIENVPLKTKESELSSKFHTMIANMTVIFDGEEKTLQQLAPYLKSENRQTREKAWRLRYERMLKEKANFNQLFNELKEIRVKLAQNAGYDNYRDYRYKESDIFSYTPQDVHRFHETVESEVIPCIREFHQVRKQKLGLDTLRPWDTSVYLDGKVLKPFNKVEDLIFKGIKVLNNLKPEYGIQLNKMYNTGFLDLDNRKGKAAGGYNSPLMEYNASFIFANVVGMHTDLVTFFHEAGHAVHSKALENEDLVFYHSCPREVAELASKTMELLTMMYWDEFYPEKADYRKSVIDQLESALTGLPFIILMDEFQHWIYTNPGHTDGERMDQFASLMDRYICSTGVDWGGLDEEKKVLWMFVFHVFGMPFYYIEYAMAQLGALAIYKQFKENKEQALDRFEAFLRLGSSKPVPELYKVAGIEFDFSPEYVRELVRFVREELNEFRN